MAAARGVRYAETLTGFKWLVRAGDGQGTGLVFAYEEALGLCVDPESVRDKDGISAAVAAADLAAATRAAGRSLIDILDELAAEHGLHRTEQISLRFTELSRIGALMAKIRANPPVELAGIAVTTEDLLPEADVLRLRGKDRNRYGEQRRHPRGGPALGHRAEAEGLPGGGHSSGDAGRRRRGHRSDRPAARRRQRPAVVSQRPLS
jgi:phosphomannomutase